jgi:hypothetical protein
MKKRPPKRRSLQERFLSTCGWCGRAIAEDQPVFSAGAKARPGVDLSGQEGQVLELFLRQANKTILAAVPGRGSPARREGKDLLFMCCSQRCSQSLTEAFQSEIDLGKRLGFGEGAEPSA